MRLVLRYWYVGYSSRLVHHSCSSLDLYQNPPLLGKGRSELNYLYPFSPPFCFIVYVVLDTDTHGLPVFEPRGKREGPRRLEEYG